MKWVLGLTASVAALGAFQGANATTYDFTKLPVGPVSPTTYAGVVITEQNPGGYVGDAQANIHPIAGLTNSVYGWAYRVSPQYPYFPTAQQIVFDFTSPVSGVSFTFDDWGSWTSAYTAYAGTTVVSSGSIGSDEGVLEVVKGAGITSLVVDNRKNDWIYGISNLTFTADVPEPATWALLILGVAMIGFAARRRNAGVALAA